jgi:LmbE family N-acetylglucosaminyl deacetylase
MIDHDNKILILSPHTDDGELGAGGTIARLSEEGKEIFYVAFSGCESVVPKDLPENILRKECLKSVEILGISSDRLKILDYEVRTFPQHRQEILEDMIGLKEQIHPDLVLVPSSNDIHQDHGTIYWEALRAFKKETSIWGYEHPWNNLTFTTDIFVCLNEKNLERKIRALQAYQTQIDKPYMDERNIRALLITRGEQVDVKFAEAFELIRLIF